MLDARSATIILSAYLAVQLFCSTVAGLIASAVAAAYGIHNLRQVDTVLYALTPAMLIPALVLGGVVMVLVSCALIPTQIKDTSPGGAAWVPGPWSAIVIALITGLAAGMGSHVVSLLKPHVTHRDLGPLARMALTPGMSQRIWAAAVVLVAPPVEEMLFRGVLYGGYRKSFGRVRAAVFTTILFTMCHIPEYIHLWPGLIVVIIEALGALWCRLHWNAIGPPIALHVGCNAGSVLRVIWRHLEF